ncbi:MAG: D-alanyl-D-alanine carboxypeptidase [Clostridia bacterium]|nr:D-alanyl-D-alanine carboxypeptidase [Clostridia bacterium]
MRNSTLFRVFILLFSFTLTITACSLPAHADDNYFPDVSAADAVFLFNLNTNKIIFSKNIDKQIFTGSLTKMVSGIIFCEYFADRIDDTVEITEQMLNNAQGAKIKLSAGDIVSYKDLLYGVICGGGNDACYALATALSGSVDAFVKLMNDTVASWGAKNTFFTNPSGYDDEKMHTTAEDALIISRIAASNSLYMEASSSLSYIIKLQSSDKEIKLFNRNSLISSFYASGYQNKHAYGLIAGFTDLGQYTAITYLEKNGTEFLCAVMGAKEDPYSDEILSYKYVNEISEYAFDNYKYQKVFDSDQYICELDVSLALPPVNADKATVDCATVDCYSGGEIYALVSPDIDVNNDITYGYYLHDKSLSAPIKPGTVVGGVDIFYNGEIIGSAKLLTGSDVEENSILFSLDRMKSFFLDRFFVSSMIIFALLLTAYFVTEHFNIKITRNKRKK